MKVTGRLRLILIPLILLMIIGIGVVPYSFFIKNIGGIRVYNDDGTIFYPSLFFSLSILLVIGFFIYRIITRTLIISIDESTQTITFFYPFKNSKKQYRFEEISSFSFSFWWTKICNFKRLNFKTSDKIYKITDFEISNFRELEKVAIENFTLSEGNSFGYLTETQKLDELNNNIKFDISQAKSYRVSAYMFCVLAVLILLSETFIPSGRKIGLGGDLICVCVLIFSISKIIQANNTIKTKANSSIAKSGADITQHQ